MTPKQKETEKWGHFRDKPDYAPLKLWKYSVTEYQSLWYIGGKLEILQTALDESFWKHLGRQKMVHSGGSLEHKSDNVKKTVEEYGS